MVNDKLKVLNTKLIEPIASMNDDELWNFLLENEERIKYLTEQDFNSHISPESGFLYGYPHGIERLRKLFLRYIEEYREGVVFTMVLDFCLSDEAVYLDYRASGGYLDNADSCDVKTSDDIMPPVDEDSDVGHKKKYFHLLEPVHVENIIRAMEKDYDKMESNSHEDIEKIKIMKEICLENEGYRVIYIYDI